MNSLNILHIINKPGQIPPKFEYILLSFLVYFESRVTGSGIKYRIRFICVLHEFVNIFFSTSLIRGSVYSRSLRRSIISHLTPHSSLMWLGLVSLPSPVFISHLAPHWWLDLVTLPSLTYHITSRWWLGLVSLFARLSAELQKIIKS